MIDRLACRLLIWLATPVSIIAFLIACLAWWAIGGLLQLTTALSIFAITTTQLVLLAQAKDTAALHKKIDGLIQGTNADDALMGIEKE